MIIITYNARTGHLVFSNEESIPINNHYKEIARHEKEQAEDFQNWFDKNYKRILKILNLKKKDILTYNQMLAAYNLWVDVSSNT